ncbi:hypothetical protein ACFX1X_038821 [Malus domestica]
MMNARSWDDADENAEHPETLSGEKKRPASLVGLAIDMAYPPRYIGFASVIILLCAVLLTAKAQTALNCATVFHEFSFCMSFVRGLSSGPLRQCCDSIKPLNAIARHDEGGPKMICECIAIECWTNKRVESEMNLVESVVKSLRSLAKESRERHPAFVIFRKDLDREIIRSHQLEIKALAHLSSLTVFGRSDSSFCTPTESTEYAMSDVNENLLVFPNLQERQTPKNPQEDEKTRTRTGKAIADDKFSWLRRKDVGEDSTI